MVTKMRSMRLSDEQWEWLAGEGKRRGSTRTGVVEALIDAAMGGAELPLPKPVVAGVSSSGPNLRQIYAAQRQEKLNAAKGLRP